jgi:hypothetical protein
MLGSRPAPLVGRGYVYAAREQAEGERASGGAPRQQLELSSGI